VAEANLLFFFFLFLGMRVAVFANARCTVGACAPAPHGWTHSFNTAFRAGGVMGFSLTGVALMR